jgi:hypothetical protein
MKKALNHPFPLSDKKGLSFGEVNHESFIIENNYNLVNYNIFYIDFIY